MTRSIEERNELIEKNEKLLYYFKHHLTKIYYPEIDEETACSIVHDAAIHAAKKWDESLGTFSSYLGQWVRSKVNAYRRYIMPRLEIVSPLSLDAPLSNFDSDTPFSEILEDIRPTYNVGIGDIMIEEFLEKIQSDENREITIRLIGGESQVQIAKNLGITRQAVAHKVRRIRRTLSAYLAQAAV